MSSSPNAGNESDELVCGVCDPLKLICPTESCRDECGRVRCGNCSKKKGEKKWVNCKICRRVVCVCTYCSTTGTSETTASEMQKELAPICLECCYMAMEEMEGFGDY